MIAMVGLPARGKTFTARKLKGYLSWLGYETRSFNVGERRRRLLGPGQDHAFFDPANLAATAEREALTDECLDEAFRWLAGEGRIAIFDATNGTRERRRKIRERCTASGVDLLFVELFESDPAVIDENVRETKVTSPDYIGVDTATAIRDFRARIAHYERVYSTLSDEDGSWVRTESRGRTIVIHQVHGWVPGRIVSFLTNLQVTRRQVWLTRHGESEFNRAGRIGGNAPLSAAGERYAHALSEHVNAHRVELPELDVWTSTLDRTIQTAAPTCVALGIEPGEWKALDEIDSGVCDGMTYEEIAERMPDEFAARQADKLRYRYPGGESYDDVIQRLDRVIIELERYRTPVLVVAHRAVLRALYGYFVQLPRERVPHIDMPLHNIIELTPTAYGCQQEWREIDVPTS